ncbi:unnamed protein product, partial [Discosporangium mesarthrocarpum]
MTFEGPAIFKENKSSDDGGGLSCRGDNAYTIFQDDTLFDDNKGDNGGAIAVDEGHVFF